MLKTNNTNITHKNKQSHIHTTPLDEEPIDVGSAIDVTPIFAGMEMRIVEGRTSDIKLLMLNITYNQASNMTLQRTIQPNLIYGY